MRGTTRVLTILAIGASVATAHTAMAKGNGDPQRSDDVPPGLAKAFAKGTPGILNAIVRTQGSNSRLQDLPTSP